jgi:two-component system sensor histidine kinase DegS
LKNRTPKTEIRLRRRYDQERKISKTLKSQLSKSKVQNKQLVHESILNIKQFNRFVKMLFTRNEEDRKAISRELHDEISQILTGINFELAIIAKESATGAKGLKEKILTTQKLVESSVEIIHRFARELRPVILDDLGLVPALKSYTAEFSKQTRIPVKFSTFSGSLSLNDFTKTVLFRAVQESLSNIAKHSKATRASVKISKIKKCIQIEIRDNGKSFVMRPLRVAPFNRRLGLLGMAERVKMANGKLKILCSPKRGTLVRVQVPFGKYQTYENTKLKV